MISEELLAMLRCPMNPSRTRLVEKDGRLVCEQCALRFCIKDGIPVLVVEEAELPAGCDCLADLPCQRASTSADPQAVPH